MSNKVTAAKTPRETLRAPDLFT